MTSRAVTAQTASAARRFRRQFDASSGSSSQLDLNITVPYIFSARLYPYGPDHGDKEIPAAGGSGPSHQTLHLQTPILFLNSQYADVYVHRDGYITLDADFDRRFSSPTRIPLSSPASLIAVYWSRASSGRKVHYRETIEPNLLNLAQSEVNIQYRYGSDFQPKSLAIITWEDDRSDATQPHPSLFQMALILGDNACFVHFVYSRLGAGSNIVAGFNGASEDGSGGENAAAIEHFSLPGSGSAQAAELLEKSNIGIPGEWLFRVDEEHVYLCGAGFQGLECVDSCTSTQWYLDCSKSCHCADGNACNTETGECPNGGKCNKGWEGSPTCDQDIDECAEENAFTYKCPNEQPDCVNTPGAFLCICYEYDNSTGACERSRNPTIAPNRSAMARAEEEGETISVPVMSLVPVLFPTSTTTRRPSAKLGPFGHKATNLNKILSPSNKPNSPVLAHGTPFQFSAISTKGLSLSHSVEHLPSTTSEEGPASAETFVVSTLSPRTIKPVLATRSSPFSTSATFGTTFVNSPTAITTHKPKISKAPKANNSSDCHMCHPQAQCIDGKCRCALGWIGDGERSCEDMNECATADNACGLHADCLNTIGSYQCVCNVGFVATSNGCVDLDECTEQIAQCRGGNTSMCVNTMGGYECRCRSGFTGHPDSAHGCVDIDECELANYYCGDKAKCVNTPGSFRCECFEGYEKASDSQRCVDMNECVHQPCDTAATCTNLNGTFQCECMEGYLGNGIECHETILYPVAKDAIHLDLKAKVNRLPAIKFERPMTLFGRSYDSALISPNGILSFDEPPPTNGLISNINSLHTINILPCHMAFNPSTSGGVSVQQAHASESDVANLLLPRATLTIQQKFHEKGFRASSVYVVTYDRMHELNIEKTNTFQLVITSSANATYLIFLYEKLDSAPRGLMGVSHPKGTMSIPTELLLHNSNIGQRGKWVVRVDRESGLGTCPSGSVGPPFCSQECAPGSWGFDCVQHCHCADEVPCDTTNGYCSNAKCAAGWIGASCDEDIDECSLGTHKCHSDATCQNSHGSHECKCQVGHVGDGIHCEKLDPCYSRFNSRCASNAHCDNSNPDYPECVCNNGFYGDGRRKCEAEQATSKSTTTATTTTTMAASSTRASSPKVSTTSRGSEEKPFVTNNLVDEGEHSRGKVAHGKEKEQKRPPPSGEKEKKLKGNEVIDRDRDIEEATLTNKPEESSADISGMMMVLVPVSLGVIWLVLMAIFAVIVCCRKRRARSRSDKYSPQMMGWSTRGGTGGFQGTRNNYFSQFTYT